MAAEETRPTVRELEPEPMNGTDAALWDIERDPALRTTVVSVLELDRAVQPKRLLRSIDESSRLMPRMRQRVVEATLGIGPPSWVVADDVDVADHVRFEELARPVTFDAVLDLAAECAMEPFDRDRPLWECVYVGGLDHGRSALIVKVHHSFTDGVGGVALLDVFLDATRKPARRSPDELPELRASTTPRSSGEATAAAVERTAARQAKLTRAAVDALRHPVKTANATLSGAQSAFRLLAPSGGALSPLFTDRGPGRALAVHAVGLDELHDAAARHGCTINDLFVAAVVGGAAAYHRAHGAHPDELRVTMPISVRRPDDEAGGNQWAPVRFRVPVDIDDPIERMLAVREITGRSRKEPALSFSHTLAGAVQVLPSSLSAGVVGEMMRGVDLVVTNVPGLSEPRYVAGAHVERLYAFAPTGGAAFNIALMSHESTACVGMISDTTAVAHPDELHSLIATGLDRTLAVAESTPPQRAVTAVEVDHRPMRLTALDTSFLRVETAESPMHIGGVIVLDGDALRDDDGELRLAEIRRHVEARLARAPRFLRRLAEVPFGQGRPTWIEDPDFDVAHHVKIATAAAPGGLDELFEVCCDLNMECLDRSRPLWELWLVDHLADGRVGLLQKVHHALLDGVSSVEFLANLFDAEPVSGPDLAVRRPVARPPSNTKLVADAWAENLRDPADTLRRASRSVGTAPSAFAEQVGQVLAVGRDLLAPRTRAPRTSLNQPVGRRRRLLAVDLSFDDIGAVRSTFGGTANDVALAVLSGGLRSWFQEHHEPLEELHAMCPVSVRSPGHEREFGNRAGSMLIPLPLAEPDPARRLSIIRERTTRAKEHHQGENVAALIDALDHVPPAVPGVVGSALRSLVAHQPFVNLVVTNIPGPRAPLWFMGAEAQAMVPVVPLGPNTALGVALVSYVDVLTVGLHADPHRCPDLDRLAEALEAEMRTLVAAL